MWTLSLGQHEDRTPTHGYEPTREAAMAAFAKSWRRPALKKSVSGEDRMNWIWTLLWLLLIAVVGVVVRPFWDEYSFQNSDHRCFSKRYCHYQLVAKSGAPTRKT